MAELACVCGHEQLQPEVLLEHAVQAEAAGVTSVDQERTIERLRAEILPALRQLAGRAAP